MSQYIYTMNGVSKVVPPKRQIIKDISLSFFPGAKIGLLGLNGAGKSTVLKIMAGEDKINRLANAGLGDRLHRAPASTQQRRRMVSTVVAQGEARERTVSIDLMPRA